VTGIKLPSGPKAYKPADSGGVVGNGARFCSFQDVTLRMFKHALSVAVEKADAHFLREMKASEAFRKSLTYLNEGKSRKGDGSIFLKK
jgi:hypothetical protein